MSKFTISEILELEPTYNTIFDTYLKNITDEDLLLLNADDLLEVVPKDRPMDLLLMKLLTRKYLYNEKNENNEYISHTHHSIYKHIDSTKDYSLIPANTDQLTDFIKDNELILTGKLNNLSTTTTSRITLSWIVNELIKIESNKIFGTKTYLNIKHIDLSYCDLTDSDNEVLLDLVYKTYNLQNKKSIEILNLQHNNLTVHSWHIIYNLIKNNIINHVIICFNPIASIDSKGTFNKLYGEGIYNQIIWIPLEWIPAEKWAICIKDKKYVDLVKKTHLDFYKKNNNTNVK